MGFFRTVQDWVRKIIYSLKKVNKTEQQTPLVDERISHANFCYLMEIIARNDITEICDVARTLRRGQNSFWASVLPTDMIFCMTSGLASLIINKLTDITNELMTGVEINNKEYQDIFTELDTELNIKRNVIKAEKKVLLVGDGAFFLYVKNGKVKYKFLAGRNVEFIYDSFDDLVEIDALKVYTVNNIDYLLKERYGKGFIKYELYDEFDQQVPLSRVPQIASLQNIEFKDADGNYIDQMFAIKFSIYDSDRYEGRGASIFENKVDYLDALDEILSQRQTELRKATSNVYVPNIYIDNDENGKPLMESTIFNSYYRVGATDTEHAKIESTQFDLRSDEYSKAEEDMEDHILSGLLDKASFKHGSVVNNTELSLQSEMITIKTTNTIKVAIQEDIPELIYAIIYLNDLMNERVTTLDKNDIKINIEEYGNPSFETQVEMTVKLNGLIPDKERLEILYGNTKTEEEIDEMVAQLHAEKQVNHSVGNTNEMDLESEKINKK